MTGADWVNWRFAPSAVGRLANLDVGSAAGHEAVIRMPVAVPIAMTVVGSEAADQAARRPLTASFHRGCLLLDGSNG